MIKQFLVISLILTSITLAQGTNPEYYQPRSIVLRPNAGLLADRAWMGEIHLGEGGSFIGGFSIGLWGRLQTGVSYGAYGVLGRGFASEYPRPSFNVKVRPLQESHAYPAVVMGYDDQGYGRWNSGQSRYSIKSPGFFLVASKNWATFGGNFGLHAGVNYSLETKDQHGFSAYVGFDKNLGKMFAFAVEYDAGINDSDKDGDFGQGWGYLNASAKWSVRPDFEIELIFADCLLNMGNAKTFSREVRLSFIYPL
ncbi:MAG TPA: hypothetical protein ENN07_04425 [candidate division Zixibacteria bacterium]|nr:hypothetical protein [candidate division Zixibacteria bacterium]